MEAKVNETVEFPIYSDDIVDAIKDAFKECVYECLQKGGIDLQDLIKSCIENSADDYFEDG